MPQEIPEYIVPFTTLSGNRRDPFTKDIERATIFCLAEMDRAKGKGVVLKHPQEKLDFIAEVCYPFWLITLDDIKLLFDGLCTTRQTLTYSTLPDIQRFIDNAQRSSRTREAYMTFLSDSLNYFQVSGEEKEKIIDGLVTDPEFLLDFHQYLRKATPVENTLPDKVRVSPSLKKSSIISIMEELHDLRSEFQVEINKLYQSMKIIKTKTDQSLEALQEEIKKVGEEFREGIQKSKTSIAEEIQTIRKEHDEKVTEYSRIVEEELVTLQQDKIKLDKIKKQLTGEIEQCEIEIKTYAVNKDDVSERKWKEKRDELKGELAETEAKIKEVDKKLKDVRDEKKLEIFKLKSECDAEIGEAEKNMVEIESSRDAKIEVYKEEMEKLEELTKSIIEQIANLAKLREKTIDQFDKLGNRQTQEKKPLIYMPFYLVCYKSDSGRRYVHFPPSIVKNVSLSVRFKGTLGRTKIKQLLAPRSGTLVSLLNKFPLLLEQNPVFNREINEACAEVNILQEKASIETGLEKLREEGWLSEKEFESFNQGLT